LEFKNGVPGEKPLKQSELTTTNSTHIGAELASNRGHMYTGGGGRSNHCAISADERYFMTSF